MVRNLGLKGLKWSHLGEGGGSKSRLCLHMIYYTLIRTCKQLMSQRYRIVLPGVLPNNTLQAYKYRRSVCFGQILGLEYFAFS